MMAKDVVCQKRLRDLGDVLVFIGARSERMQEGAYDMMTPMFTKELREYPGAYNIVVAAMKRAENPRAPIDLALLGPGRRHE